MRELALGLLVGGALGAVMARGAVCFNTGVRRAAFGGGWRVLRVFALALAIAAGVVLTWRFLLGPRPQLRGVEGGRGRPLVSRTLSEARRARTRACRPQTTCAL